MAKLGNRTVKGTIRSNKGRHGKKYLQLQPYNAEILIKAGKIKSKRFSIGLEDTAKNRKTAFAMLEVLYKIALKLEDTNIETYKTPSLFEAWNEFYNVKSQTVTKRTIRDYKKSFEKIYKYDFAIDESTTANYNNVKTYKIIELLENYIKENINKRSVNNNLRSVGVFLKWCMEKGYIPNKNISKLRVKFPEKEVEIYNPEEIKIISDELKKKDKELYLWFQLLLETGMRIGETIMLRWEMINLDENYLVIPNKKDKTKLQALPISSNCKKILLELKKINKKRKLKKVFRWETQRYLNKIIDNIQLKHGIKKPGRSVHATRKTFATSLIRNGVDIYSVKELMRHADIKTTLKIYHKEDLNKNRAILDQINAKKGK